MVRIGRISYGLYVYHFFFPYILPWMVGQQYIRLTSPWHYAGLSVAGSVGGAVLSWYLIEKPILGLKKHFSPHGVPLARPGAPAGG
jgi:peptidoglycan/LPS O-acetylase OafA/YrhL